MAADDVLSRELKSLQEELSAAQRDRPGTPAMPAAQPVASAQPGQTAEEQHQLRDQLAELANSHGLH
jgi:hypothetical protein